LSESMTHRELYELFSQYGYVISCRVSLRENFTSRRYGFVLYKKAIDAQKAISHVSFCQFNICLAQRNNIIRQ
jgi:RNA recognition motif-containing protein